MRWKFRLVWFFDFYLYICYKTSLDGNLDSYPMKEKIMDVLGIDIGFGFTKATNGKDTIIFKSITGEATDIQFWSDFGVYFVSGDS